MLLNEELVTNGTFAADSNWSKGTGWSIAAGVASCDGSQTASSNLSQITGALLGKKYKLTFTVSNQTAGVVKLQFTGTTGALRSANGTYSQYMTTVSSTNLVIRANVDFVGDVDDISVKRDVGTELSRTGHSFASRQEI